MDLRRLKTILECFFLKGPEEDHHTPANLTFTVPTQRPGALGVDMMRALASCFLGSAWPNEVTPILEHLARLELWDDYVDLDDQELLPSERSLVGQRLARRLNMSMTAQQAARFIAYLQVKEASPHGIEWFRLAQFDPDLKPIYEAHMMYGPTDSLDYSRFCDQLVAEYEE